MTVSFAELGSSSAFSHTQVRSVNNVPYSLSSASSQHGIKTEGEGGAGGGGGGGSPLIGRRRGRRRRRRGERERDKINEQSKRHSLRPTDGRKEGKGAFFPTHGETGGGGLLKRRVVVAVLLLLLLLHAAPSFLERERMVGGSVGCVGPLFSVRHPREEEEEARADLMKVEGGQKDEEEVLGRGP